MESLCSLPIFTCEQIHLLDKTKIPKHVAIIPDGNRRWAKKEKKLFHKGHQAGAKNLIDIIKAGKAIGIKVMTFYLFSTENWTRSREEVMALMWLLKKFLNDYLEDMLTEGICLNTVGNPNAFPKDVVNVLNKTIAATEHCNEIDMVLALNYGGRDEILRVFHRLIEDHSNNKITKEQITENLVATYLDTSKWQDPELLIRTSGEMRLSNFLLWQLSYTEIYVTELLWPEFKSSDLLEAIVDFQKRQRRLGGT